MSLAYFAGKQKDIRKETILSTLKLQSLNS